jgi:hypothetical protein
MVMLSLKVSEGELARLRREAAAGGMSLSEHVRRHLGVERPLDLRTFHALLDVARARAKGGTLSGAERRRLRELARLIVAAVQEQDAAIVEELTAPRPR